MSTNVNSMSYDKTGKSNDLSNDVKQKNTAARIYLHKPNKTANTKFLGRANKTKEKSSTQICNILRGLLGESVRVEEVKRSDAMAVREDEKTHVDIDLQHHRNRQENEE